ncbi:MAG: DUF72 domain-containing protein [Candidatus Heimdallarchaeota archaeon]|nr:DUF72 domain-containing protein [Candidatus Heimdallarchaeota archaeon]
MIYIGTTGWDSTHWNGSFYPDKTINRLEYYSNFSSFCELKSTYNKIPTENDIAFYDKNTPKRFIFTVRVPHVITQDWKELKTDSIQLFLERFKELEKKIGTYIFKFPREFEYSVANQKFLLKLLSHCRELTSAQFVVDAHRSWQLDEIKTELSAKMACLIGTDMNPLSSLVRDNSFYYLRLMGNVDENSNRVNRSILIDRSADLKYWGEHLKFLNNRVKSIFVCIDDNFSGHAVKDAYLLSKILDSNKVQYKGFQSPNAVPKRKVADKAIKI